MEYKVLKGGLDGEITVVESPKKLKTRAMDFINIKKTPTTEPEVKVEEKEPEVKVEEKEPEVEVEPEVKEEPKDEMKEEIAEEKEPEEVKVEEKEPEVEAEPEVKDEIGVFAYSAHVKEDEIDEDAIKQIKDLGDAYKGQPKQEHKKHEKQEKKEEKKVTEKEFQDALDKESFSPKTREYKNKIREEYQKILDEIKNNKKRLDEVTAEYGKEKNIGNKLQDRKADSEKVMDGINGLKLDFLVDRKDQKSIDTLTILESLFNEHRQNIIDTMQEIKKCDERKKDISKEEQGIRNEGVELNDKKSEFEEKNYPKLTSINEIDEETRRLEESLTEVTGIKDDYIAEEKNKVVSVTNPFGETVNPFDRVRSDSVNPEKHSARRVA